MARWRYIMYGVLFGVMTMRTVHGGMYEYLPTLRGGHGGGTEKEIAKNTSTAELHRLSTARSRGRFTLSQTVHSAKSPRVDEGKKTSTGRTTKRKKRKKRRRKTKDGGKGPEKKRKKKRRRIQSPNGSNQKYRRRRAGMKKSLVAKTKKAKKKQMVKKQELTTKKIIVRRKKQSKSKRPRKVLRRKKRRKSNSSPMTSAPASSSLPLDSGTILPVPKHSASEPREVLPMSCNCGIDRSSGIGKCYYFLDETKLYCRRRECKPKFICITKDDNRPSLTCIRKKKTRRIVRTGAGICREVEWQSYMYVPYTDL